MTAPQVPIWRLAWEVSQWHPRQFKITASQWIGFNLAPVLFGWATGQAFSAIESGDRARVLTMAGLVLASQLIQAGFLVAGVLSFTKLWVLMESLLQGNMLAAQVASGRPDAGRPVPSAGESIARFRDDTHDIVWFIDSWIDVMAGVAFTVGAVALMITIHVPATLVTLVIMVSIAFVTLVLDQKIKEFRQLDREATMAVTGFLGDVLTATTAIKVGGAIDQAVDRLAELTDHRRKTAVRDRVLNEGIAAWGNGATDVAFAMVVVIGAPAIASGAIGVGELAAFLGLLLSLGMLPRMTGRMLARRKQSHVAFDGMRQLVADQQAERVTMHRDLPVQTGAAVAAPMVDRVRLDRVEVVGMGVRFPTGGGVAPTSFTMDRGSFTVVTGPVGSGKSSLLRAIIGLIQPEWVTGRVDWNGEEVDDRASFFQPPRSAYLPQVPQLLSDSVADNILLGRINLTDDNSIGQALTLATVDSDIDEMPDGLSTMIGPRGLRLSGGQRQRVAAARALVTMPELVVLDDISSALDVKTEVMLWTNLAEVGATVLAVSHRKVALDRADQVITLGRAAD